MTNKDYLRIVPLSNALGLPVKYLLDLAKKNEIPFLWCGHQRFFNLDRVRVSLAKREIGAGGGGVGDG